MLQALKEFDLYDDTHCLHITGSNTKNFFFCCCFFFP